MQILDDNFNDFGNVAKRILALREKVKELLENQRGEISVDSGKESELVHEITLLKKQLESKENKIKKLEVTEDNSKNNAKLVKEINELKKELIEKETSIKKLSVKNISSEKNEELLQENALLKKQISSREKTIKELRFKLEMFKMAKNLREGAGVDSKSEDLKKMITEYIKEIDKSITSLNIE